MNFANGRNERDDVNAVNLFQVPFSNGTSSDTSCSHHLVRTGVGWRKIGLTNGLASTATSTSTACLDAVLFEVRVVCMARARIEVCFGVVFWTLILVSDEESDRCSKSNPVFDSRLKLDQIFFVSLSMEYEMRKVEL